MGIKEKIFVGILIFFILIPFFFKEKYLKIEKSKTNLPSIVIENGNFKKFEKNLLEKGVFSKLDYITDNNYIIYDLNMTIMKKSDIMLADKVHFNKIYNFFNFTYITKDYIYKSNKLKYNQITKVANSDYFKFFNKKIDGRGENMVYKNDIITANNIDYIIKGFK